MEEKKVCPNPKVAKWLVGWAASVPEDFWPAKVKAIVEACPEIREAIEAKRGVASEEEEAQ